AAHADVIVDIHQLGGQAFAEEPGDEERDVAHAPQRVVALLESVGVGGFGKHDGERLEADALAIVLEERFRTCEQSEQVDYVVCGVVARLHPLTRHCRGHRFLEEFLQAGNRLYSINMPASHMAPSSYSSNSIDRGDR